MDNAMTQGSSGNVVSRKIHAMRFVLAATLERGTFPATHARQHAAQLRKAAC
jgi:hypothetical protein